MTTKVLQLNAKQCKLKADGRIFSGYASVYNNQNCYGFSIAPGAYDGVIASHEMPKMFFNHDLRDVPIGIWTKLESDETGLKVTGELTEGLDLADRVLACIHHGSLDSLSVSIAFSDEDLDGTHSLKRVKRLDEISVVTFPADKKAKITEALSAEQEAQIKGLNTEKDLEDFLRDAGGLSRARAKQFLSQAKSCLIGQREADLQIDSQLLADICRQSKKFISQ